MRGYSLSLWVATCTSSDGQQLSCFQCCIRDCEFYSLRKEELFEHMRLHTPLDLETRCKCPVDHCGMLFDGDVPYFNHLSYHDYEVRLQLEGLRVLMSHDKRAAPLPPCLRLPYSEVDKHFYDGNVLQCLWLKCNETFFNIEAYFEHVRSHGHKKLFRPNFQVDCCWKDCNFKTISAYNLRRHLCSHTGERMCACPYCGISFANNTKMRDHLLRQQTVCEHKCAYCQKQFATERLLHEHSRSHIHNYKCPICSVSVHSRHNLRRHFLSKHQKILSFSCSLCPYRCRTKFELTQHTGKHFPHKPYSCDFCPKKFKRRYTCLLHMRAVHTNTKLYDCHLCSSRFEKGIQLTAHLGTSHGVFKSDELSRFRYKLCGDGFYRLVSSRFFSPRISTPSVEHIKLEIANNMQTAPIRSRNELTF